MTSFVSPSLLFAVPLVLSACSLVPKPQEAAAPVEAEEAALTAPQDAAEGEALAGEALAGEEAAGKDPAAPAPPKRPPASARTVEQFDTTTKADRSAAVATPEVGGGTLLGRSIASLGTPTEAGFWVKTPLVQTRSKGRVTVENGNSVQVDLIPLEGAETGGSQISLAAMRLLGVALTDLPEVRIYQQ